MLINYRSSAVYLARSLYTLTINPTPSDATVSFDVGTVSGNSTTVPYDTNVTYTVSRTGYQTYSSLVNVRSNITESVSLTRENYTLSISPTPSDATVVLTASGYTQVGNSITVPYETVVHCIVSRNSLVTYENDLTVYSTHTENIILQYPANTVLFESGTPGTYSITPLVPGTYNTILVGGGSGGCGALLQADGARWGIASAGGGSGGYTNKNVNLQNINYSIRVGSGGAGNSDEKHYSAVGDTQAQASGIAGGSSSIGSVVSVGGGTASAVTVTGTGSTPTFITASSSGGSGGSGETANGYGGTHADQEYATENTLIRSAGGSSRYNGYGAGGNAEVNAGYIGQGGYATAVDGTAGYIKITYVGPLS